ncbi:hypothetical protein [Marinagarivorans algicola]|uniref:hypothetical protein n=1 Tax=Marinagarivorans algicola TaxID=1513270 RepID=UPI0006B92D28|nr:hypothetical protein [Marinagarivorans algicola]
MSYPIMKKITEADWDRLIKELRYDEDVVYAKKIFWNKSDNEIMDTFESGFAFTERSEELLYMPAELFNYYYHYFPEFVIRGNYDRLDTPSVANSFIQLLEEKLEDHSFHYEEPLVLANNALDFILDNIDRFNTDPGIYGDFLPRIKALKHSIQHYPIARH